MNRTIAFPQDDRFLEDLILQRTGDFIKFGGQSALTRWFANGDRSQLVAHLRQNGAVEAFLQETTQRLRLEAEELTNTLYVPLPRQVVSIGPGNGIVELFLFYYLRLTAILLVDIENSDVHAHGFSNQGSGYALLASTKAFMVANGVPEPCILTCNPRNERLPSMKFDLLVSLLSMGFHYPCDEYVEYILANLSGKGCVVIDKRRGAQDFGYSRLSSTLRTKVLTQTAKSERVVLTRSIAEAAVAQT